MYLKITFLNKICYDLRHRRAGEGLLPEPCRRSAGCKLAVRHGGGADCHHDQKESGLLMHPSRLLLCSDEYCT